MTDGGYEVVQLQEPTAEAFDRALADAGMVWPEPGLLDRHRHPGLRTVGDTVALVLQPVTFDEAADRVVVTQLAMVLGPDSAVVARWPGDGMDAALAPGAESWREVLVAVIEEVHDIDTEAMAALEERIDDCELEVLDANGHGTSAQSIYHLEREVLTMRRAVAPMVVVMDRLARRGEEAEKLRLAEWRERYARLVAQMEDLDNLLTSVLSVNLTLVSVRQNEDMRRIAAWGAIGIAPTAMAGVWGMNFEHMPELDWTLGYPLALGSIAVVCGGLYRFFRRSGWL